MARVPASVTETVILCGIRSPMQISNRLEVSAVHDALQQEMMHRTACKSCDDSLNEHSVKNSSRVQTASQPGTLHAQ